MMSTLRMQNFSIIGQGVPEIQGVTDRHTQDEDLLYRLLLHSYSQLYQMLTFLYI